MSTTLDMLLDRFRAVTLSNESSVAEVSEECARLMRWLCVPGNRTDEHCSRIDTFVLQHFLADAAGRKAVERLPSPLALIIEDMGSQLHDSITDPVIAEQFESTPEMLLKRLEEL